MSRWLWMTSKSAARPRTAIAVATVQASPPSVTPAGRRARGTVTTCAPGTSESPLAKVVTWWPRRTSSTTSSWTTRSVPP